MAAHENDKPKAKEKDGKVTSDVGETEPPQVFGGDGVTPIAEWREKWAEKLKNQAEIDERRRAKATEEAAESVMQTTGKGK